jgi:hypothetical protein
MNLATKNAAMAAAVLVAQWCKYGTVLTQQDGDDDDDDDVVE